jgi:hypothetical protein
MTEVMYPPDHDMDDRALSSANLTWFHQPVLNPIDTVHSHAPSHQSPG